MTEEEDHNDDRVVRKKIEEIHEAIPIEFIPKVGMEFDTEDDAHTFYNSYAYKVGFSVRISKGNKGVDGKIVNRVFCCSCEGFRQKDKRDPNTKNPRAQTRFGCLAKMKVNSRLTGKYRVTEFVAEHTHETTTPSKSHLLRSQRKITSAQAQEVDLAESSGIAPKASCELMARRAGGRENLGFIPEDYRNYLRSKRTTQMRSGDTGGVLEYLQQMQLEDTNFFYAIQVDEDDLIANIFWADAKMKNDYSYFGDVVSFDTTYRKNKEDRPFAMFVGVNHHKLSILFGAALLYDETAESFVWLFNTFAKSMLGKKPQTILTDQDAAMAKALSLEWPETCHRLCIWHLNQRALKKLSFVFAKFEDFSKDFNKCIYDHEEEEEFLVAWNSMLEKYDLKDNKWLKKTFALKEKRALVYGRENFCADMTTTQRSESLNSLIKKYVSYKHSLLRFFQHFQRVVDDRRYEESKADFKATQRSLALSFDVAILRHAATIYTPTVYKMIQLEVSKAYDNSMDVSFQNEDVTEYKVTSYKKHFQHTVQYYSSTGAVKCSCKRFEFSGILCSHAFKILASRNITKVPEMYILKRWTKHAKVTNNIAINHPTSHEDPKVRMTIRRKDLGRMYAQLLDKGTLTEETYNIVVNGWRRTMNEIDACLEGRDDDANAHCASSINTENDLCNAKNNNVRGIKKKESFRGSSTRPKSALERRKKKKKTVKPDEPSLKNLDPELPSTQPSQVPIYVPHSTSKEPTSNMSMMELLKAQVLSIEHGHGHGTLEGSDTVQGMIKNVQYINQFPSMFRCYIEKVIDVDSDGNCGYRAVAALLGGREDNWNYIRVELLNELQQHSKQYLELYGTPERFKTIHDALFLFPGQYATKDKWMDLPDMGYLIATRFQLIFISLSSSGCMTFFPLRGNPPPVNSQKIIAVGFVNKNHYVQVFLKEGHPMPTVALQWRWFCSAQAKEWEFPYLQRLQDFDMLLQRNNLGFRHFVDITQD